MLTTLSLPPARGVRAHFPQAGQNLGFLPEAPVSPATATIDSQ